MNIKNVNIGEYTLRDLLVQILDLGRISRDYEDGYNNMSNKIKEILRELK